MLFTDVHRVDRRQTVLGAHLSALWLDANAFIDSRPNTLLAAEASLGRLDRDVPKKKLDLLQFTAREIICDPGAVRPFDKP